MLYVIYAHLSFVCAQLTTSYVYIIIIIKENKHDLGKWIQRQRQLYKNTYITPHARKNFGQLSDEQRDKLLAVGMTFDAVDGS
jgi:hypothetical protein